MEVLEVHLGSLRSFVIRRLMLEVLLLFLCCECITVHWQILLLFCSLLRYCYCFVLCRLVSFSHIVIVRVSLEFISLYLLLFIYLALSFFWLLPLLGLPFIHSSLSFLVHLAAPTPGIAIYSSLWCCFHSPVSILQCLSPVASSPGSIPYYTITLLRFCGAGCCSVQTV